ncbi:MAG TPA: hypothetical protein VJU61_20415 [Polyangiaceae bacterium]|nr:hypothetical protein [Polyangiaceae bacterium]
MDPHRIQLKIFAQPGFTIDTHRSVRVYHRWIKEHVLPEQVVDVADYSHVHHGPRIALIGHGSDYYLDDSEGRPGLLYFRKRAAPPPHERLADAFRRCLTAARLLEKDPGFDAPPKFGTGELLLRFVDRLQAPNTEAGYAPLRELVEPFLAELYRTPVRIVREGTERELLSLRIQAESAPTLDVLLERLGGSLVQPKKRLLKLA